MAIVEINTGMKLTLYFSLKLEDGSVIDSNFDKQPASFVVGDGSLLPAFEAQLLGLAGGNKKSVLIPAEDAFGLPQAGNIKNIDLALFREDMELSEGLVVGFTDASGGEIPGVVRKIEGGVALVDFNHPLSGKNIQFDVAIVEVTPASTQ